MKPSHIFRALFSFTLLLFLLQPAEVHGAGLPISKITIKGRHRIERAAILEKVSQRLGKPINRKKVDDDIRNLFALGYFDQIEFHSKKLTKSVELVIIVKERPVVADVRYEGLSKLDEDDLKDAILMKKYMVYDPALASESTSKIRAIYEGKGFYLAHAYHEVKAIKGDKSKIDLVFHVQENDKVRVKKINFLGNKVFQDSDLKGIIKTREGNALGWLTDAGNFTDTDLERDMQILSYWYYNHGYVQVQLGKPQISISPDKRFVYITITVKEGEQFRIGKIDFNGDLLFTEEELRNELSLSSGDIFSSDALRKEVLHYTAKYGDLGYAFANVVPNHSVRPKERLVDLNFIVEKGEKVRIGRITMVGNTKTRDKVIRRELKIKEGELYNESRVRKSRENVERLGFFEKGVAFNKSVRPGTKDVLDIKIIVKERNTGTLTIGAGFSSADGFIANAQVSQENFLGYGHRMAFFGIYSKSASRFNLSYDDPYFWDTEWSLGGDLYRAERNVFSSFGFLSFQELKLGGDVRVGHPIAEFVRVFGTYKLEDVNLNNEFSTSVIKKEDNEGLVSSVSAQINRDTRNNRIDPTSGSYQEARVEVAGLGGDLFFAKVDLNYRFFTPIWWKFVFRSNVEYGYVGPIGGKNLPVNQRYVLGGPYSLRGYQPLTVGSVVCAVADDPGVTTNIQNQGVEQGKCGELGNPNAYPWVLGGRHKIMGTAEIEFPIFEQIGIKSAFFFDIGQAFDSIRKPTPSSDPQKPFVHGPGLLYNWGFEIRWFSPIGPLRFIFGFPFVALPGGNKDMVFNFTIGPSF